MKNNSLSVLIINSEHEKKNNLPFIIENFGHNVKVSFGCYKAIQKILQDDFDIIFVEVNMPDCDGIELMARLNILYPDLLIVALTDGVSRLEELRIREARSCILIKPFTSHDIQGVLDHVVKRKCVSLENQSCGELSCNQ